MKDKTMSEAGVDFSYDQDSNEQKHTLLIASPLETSAPKQAECNPSTCNPAPESPENSSAWGEDNATCKSFIKPETSYVGLVNQAMTCYLNSLLQALYMTPEFRNALYNWEYVNGSEKDEANSIPYQLQKLFLNLQTSSKSAVETTALTKSFGWDSTEAWQQHDIQELCRVMFDALEQKFKNTEQADLINRLYEGKMIDYVKCLECDTEKSREDAFLDIPLPVRPFGSNVAYNSVEDALRAFVQYEILEGNNQYYCEKCNKKCDAHKGLKFTKFPYLLTFHLKRFDFDFKTFHRIKLNDKVTFPDTLNLNHFILSISNQESPSSDENSGLAKCDDSSTADSGTLDDDYPLCENSLPSSNHSTNYDQDDDHDEGIDMSNGQSTSNCTVHNHENEKHRNKNAAKGPYNYELFSIMIHSGSASGGHYYAYIKDFRTGEWLCFNDQSVTPITHDDIQKTYGGGPSRPYYGGAYSSTNAYMLMYRQIDSERNALPMQVQDFPKHIQELLKKMRDERKELLQIIEKEDDYKKCFKKERYRRRGEFDLTVFCQYPMESKNFTRRLSIEANTTLAETTNICYKQFHLENVVSLEQCRLLNYDQNSDTIICSYEGREQETLRKLFFKMSSKGITLLLEICDKDKKFESYQGDIVTKVNVIDVPRRKLLGRIDVRALYTQTVKEYKEMVGKIVNMNPDEMKLVLRKQKTDMVLIGDEDDELEDAEFTNGVNVYIPTMLDTEWKASYHSALCEIIENFEKIITVFIALPDTSPEILEELNIPSLDEKCQGKEKPVADSPSKTSVTESQRDAAGPKCNEASKNGKCSETAPARNVSPQLGESEEWNSSEQSNSEDSSLSDSDKTLVGDAPEDNDIEVPHLSLNTNNRAIVMMNQIEFENWDNVNDDSEYYFKATHCDKKCLEVQVDKRMKFDIFKKNLEPYVGVPADCFKIHRLFKDYDESRVQIYIKSLDCYEDGQKFQIRLGRSLRNNEIRIKLYQFIMYSSEPLYKFLYDWIVSEDMTVSEAKKDILAELKRKFDIDIPYERCRLREKCSTLPCKALLDDQKFGSLPKFYGELDLILQELPDVEPVTNSNQILVFIRRWSPSKMQLGPVQEIVIDGKSVEELRKKLSTISDIPEEYVDIARAKGYLPYNLSLLRIQHELAWNGHLFETKFEINDGLMFLYRDVREALKQLTFKEFNEIGVLEVSRFLSYSSTPRSHTRKEKALRIQLATE